MRISTNANKIKKCKPFKNETLGNMPRCDPTPVATGTAQ